MRPQENLQENLASADHFEWYINTTKILFCFATLDRKERNFGEDFRFVVEIFNDNGCRIDEMYRHRLIDIGICSKNSNQTIDEKLNEHG